MLELEDEKCYNSDDALCVKGGFGMKQQLTKNVIRESFLKLLALKTFDKITVKSIVEDCGLTRNTFYYYYEDTYDILDDILTQEIIKYSKLTQDGFSSRDVIAKFCDFAESNQNLVGHVLKSAKWDEIKVYVLKAVDKGRPPRPCGRSGAGADACLGNEKLQKVRRFLCTAVISAE